MLVDIIEPPHELSNNVVCVTSKASYQWSDQRLYWSLEYSITVKQLSEHHLEFLSLKGGCTGWSESTLVKMRHLLLEISYRGSYGVIIFQGTNGEIVYEMTDELPTYTDFYFYINPVTGDIINTRDLRGDPNQYVYQVSSLVVFHM